MVPPLVVDPTCTVHIGCALAAFSVMIMHEYISIAALQVEFVLLACCGLCVRVVLHVVGCVVRDESVHGHCTRRRTHTGALCGSIAGRLSAELSWQSICADLAHHIESPKSCRHHASEPRQAFVLVCIEV
jgi:hypothetical protein